jgi:hypothetical protein
MSMKHANLSNDAKLCKRSLRWYYLDGQYKINSRERSVLGSASDRVLTTESLTSKLLGVGLEIYKRQIGIVNALFIFLKQLSLVSD